MSTIAIVEYGMGNLRSVAKAFAHVAPDQRVLITSEASEIESAERVVLPGQAAMPESMAALEASGLRAVLDRVSRDRPFFGVCLGLQMLFESTEEGDVAALGYLRGRNVRFARGLTDAEGRVLKVPHMGWNPIRIAPAMRGHPCWAGVPDGSAFYFAHSYYAQPADASVIAGSVDYPDPICVAVARDNVFAVQFHPEKSADAGLRVLRNFTTWNGTFNVSN